MITCSPFCRYHYFEFKMNPEKDSKNGIWAEKVFTPDGELATWKEKM